MRTACRRKELHPIGAALDPTAFEADEPGAAPLAQQQAPIDRQAGHAAAPKSGTGADSNSDDDFNPDVLQVSRPTVVVARTSGPPLSTAGVAPAGGAPTAPPSAAVQLPADIPLDSNPPNRDPPHSVSPPSMPEPPCTGAMYVSAQETGTRVSLAAMQDGSAADACGVDASMDAAHVDAGAAEEGKHAERPITASMELHAGASSAPVQQQARAADHVDQAEHSASAEVPLKEHRQEVQRAEALRSSAAASGPGMAAAADDVPQGAAPQASTLDMSQAQHLAIAVKAVESAERTLANGAVASPPAAAAEGATKVAVTPVRLPEPEQATAKPDVAADVAHVLRTSLSLELQDPRVTAQHSTPALTSSCNTESAQEDSKPDSQPSLEASVPAEDCRGASNMLDLLQSQRVLETPLPAASDMHAAAGHMETPDWLKDDTQDPSGGAMSDTPVAEVAPGVAASTDVPMFASPQPPCLPSESLLAAPVSPAPTSQALLPCSTDNLDTRQRDAATPATQSLLPDLAARPDASPAAVGEAHASHSMQVVQAASAPCSPRQTIEHVSEPCAEPDATLPVEHRPAGKGEQPPSAPKPAAKPKVNKELARLTLFHWDKLAGEHPVGVRT